MGDIGPLGYTSSSMLKTIAVVIGVNRSPGLSVLQNAENDARCLRQFLAGPRGAVGAEDIIAVIGADATVSGVRAALIKAARLRPDVLFVIFSGHGSGDAIFLYDHPLPHAVFAADIQQVGATKGAVIMDACQAGAFAAQFGFDSLSGIPDEQWQTHFRNALPGLRFLLASRSDEYSSDGTGQNGSFTAALLAGLDYLPGTLFAGGRSYITAEAALAFARDWVQRESLGAQNPVAFGPVADFPLALPAPPQITFPTRRAPPPQPRSSTGGFWAGLLSVGALVGGVYLASRAPRWDRNVDRYRTRDGRFW